MTHKLLAVDDSKTMRKVLEITFGGEDYAATICGSAADALSALRDNPPEVALVDGYLGAGGDGYDLARQIKTAAPSVRVLILSSKHRPYDEARGGAAGADGNFDKPFDSQKLLDKISQLTGGAPAPAPVPRPAIAAVAPAPQVSAAPRPIAPLPSAAPRPAVAASPQPSVGPRPAVPASAGIPSRAAQPIAAPAAVAPAPVAPAPVAPAPVAPAPVAPARPAAAAVAGAAISAGLEGKLSGLGLSAAQIESVLALSRSVVEQVVWEVVPVLAESLIKEEIARLTAE